MKIETPQSNPSRRWPSRLAATACTSVAAALLLGTGMVTAGLVLEVKPSDYNAADKKLTINSGSLTGDHFQGYGDPVKVASAAGTTYSGIQLNGSSWFSGPLCPAELSAAGNRTVEAWVYSPTGVPGDAGLIFDTSCRKWAFYNGGFGAALIDTPWITWNASTAARQGKWVFLAASYDGTSLRLYADGVIDKTTTVAYTYNALSSMTIGSGRWGGRDNGL